MRRFLLGAVTVLEIAGTVLLGACAGPSKERLSVLLHECRDANRERVRIIKEYRSAGCRSNPEQQFGNIAFDEAGH